MFAGPIENITVNVGREAVLECPVNHLGKYKVGWLKAKDQTIHSPFGRYTGVSIGMSEMGVPTAFAQ